MKKILILTAVLMISFLSVEANENIKSQNLSSQKMAEIKLQREKAFEKRLGLTEEQKAKAKEIRIKGHETIKPVIEEIKVKKQEAKMVKMSRIAVQVQEERLMAIDSELKILEKKAHDIRKANMKEFESILTREQKKILKQMKKEGRRNYQVNRQKHMPMPLSLTNKK